MPAIPYSRRNLPTGPRAQDSETLRNRVAMYLDTIGSDFKIKAWKEVAINTGSPRDWTDLGNYLRTCQWGTFVDCMAHVANGLPSSHQSSLYASQTSYPRRKWLEFVRPAFDEEYVSFRIDAEGSPQPVVDVAFSELVEATLDGLNAPQFANAKSDVLAALRHMKKSETLDEAIDSTFKAAENIYKMSSGATRLDKNAEKYYRTHWAEKLDLTEKNAVARMICSLGEWVNAAHNYRQADNQPAPTSPSRETAVWMISAGMAHIRWMAHVHCEKDKAKAGG